MVCINASNKILNILKQFNISINALQYVLTTILQIYTKKYDNKNVAIKLIYRFDSKNYGLYEFNTKRIIICLPCLKNKEIFISSLLHEFRHWIQHNVDNISPIAIISKGIKYENNAYEKQCCDFEKIALAPVLELLNYYNTLYIHFTNENI